MTTREFRGRTLARSQALQLLFQADVTNHTVEEVLAGPYALSKGPLDEFGEFLARGTDAMRDELDVIIGNASTNWSVSRMPAVDRNLLRLALFEMLKVDEVAIAVSIDESVELAKAYGTDESSRFVNGLLGRIAAELEEGVLEVGMPEAAEPQGGAVEAVVLEGSTPQDDGVWPDDEDGDADGAGQASGPSE